MTLTLCYPADLNQSDMKNLLRACEASYCGFGPNDILRAALTLDVQIWRWPKGGIIVTRIEHFPAGKQLFVLMLAGENLLDQLAEAWFDLVDFAMKEKCTWLAGATEVTKLAERFDMLKPAKRFEYMVFDVEEQSQRASMGFTECGLLADTNVAMADGTIRAAVNVLVGDLLAGPGGPQRVDAIEWGRTRAVAAGKMAAGTKVRHADGSWRMAANMWPHDVSETSADVVEFTVTPGHEFNLADGTTVHNKGGSQPSHTTQTSKPWWGEKDALLNVYDQAKGASDAAGTQAQNGPQVGDIVQGYVNASHGADAGQGQVRQLGLDSLEGKYLNPSSNPYFSSALGSAQQNLVDQYQQNVLPSIGHAAAHAGAYGGSRQGVAEGLASQGLERSLGDMSSQMTYQNYEQERQNQLGAAGLLGQANQLGTMPLNFLQQGYTLGQTLPFTGAQNYGNIVNGVPSFGTSTGTSVGGGQSAISGGIQGGLGGAATGAALASVIPGFGPGIGAAVGGGLGLIGGLF